MIEWLSIPRLLDCILLGMAFEALWLQRRHKQQGGAGAPGIILHLASGALLLISMRLALTDYPSLLIAAVLGCAGCCHFVDVRRALMTQH
ncbi:MAG: hypothetical protein CBC82_03415 [Cellvibrionales bacterium TMED122]|nr:MAG: hypothetical protein CBC82_03415 [Cellvibrionales bacterium TMED122]